MSAVRQFEPVVDNSEPETTPRASKTSRVESIATDALMLALKALSQRAVIALDNLFTLITVGLVFWVWMSIPDPNPQQLVALGMFALFVLAANVIVRRK